MSRILGSESWSTFCARVAAATGLLSWRWAAVGRESGEWSLIALVLEVDPSSKSTPRQDRYPEAIIAVEELDAETAAARLLAFTASPDDDATQVLIPEQQNAVPQWIYSCEQWGLTPSGWPRLVAEVGGGATTYADPSQPLLAAGVPFYPSLGEAIAERVFRLPPELVRLGQHAPVSVRLNDRRGRIAAIDAGGENVSVKIEEGTPGGLDGFHLYAAWRSELALEEWSRSDHALLGPETVAPETDGVPAEFVAALVDPDGNEVDRCIFERRLHLPVNPAETFETSVARWIEEGEHAGLEYKRELNDAKARRSFADTVAAFANGTGGAIVIGVDDEGEVVGWKIEKPVDQITNIVADLVAEMPTLDVDEVLIEEKPIVVVRVAPSPLHLRPHLVRGRVMIRALATTRPATPAQLRELTGGAQ